MKTLSRLIDRIKLYCLRRNEFESLALRKWFTEKWGIDVGLYSYGCFDSFRIPGKITIGRYCSFSDTARVINANHPISLLTSHPYIYDTKFGVVAVGMAKSAVCTIEDDVWVGHNAIILPSCKYIGRGAIIGAGAVVTKPVPPYAIVAGNPARLIRHRFDEITRAEIEKTNWWNLDKKELAQLLRAKPGFAKYLSARF